jgi:hypothetical protein
MDWEKLAHISNIYIYIYISQEPNYRINITFFEYLASMLILLKLSHFQQDYCL